MGLAVDGLGRNGLEQDAVCRHAIVGFQQQHVSDANVLAGDADGIGRVGALSAQQQGVRKLVEAVVALVARNVVKGLLGHGDEQHEDERAKVGPEKADAQRGDELRARDEQEEQVVEHAELLVENERDEGEEGVLAVAHGIVRPRVRHGRQVRRPAPARGAHAAVRDGARAQRRDARRERGRERGRLRRRRRRRGQAQVAARPRRAQPVQRAEHERRRRGRRAGGRREQRQLILLHGADRRGLRAAGGGRRAAGGGRRAAAAADGSAARADLRDAADVRAARPKLARRQQAKPALVCVARRFFDSSACGAHSTASRLGRGAAARCGSLLLAAPRCALCAVGRAAARHRAVRLSPPRTAAPRAAVGGGAAEASPPRQTRASSPPARVKRGVGVGGGGPKNARAHICHSPSSRRAPSPSRARQQLPWSPAPPRHAAGDSAAHAGVGGAPLVRVRAVGAAGRQGAAARPVAVRRAAVAGASARAVCRRHLPARARHSLRGARAQPAHRRPEQRAGAAVRRRDRARRQRRRRAPLGAAHSVGAPARFAAFRAARAGRPVRVVRRARRAGRHQVSRAHHAASLQDCREGV
ncbi:phospholipid-transporting ATPase IIA [Gracilaria domingensis]|nr:phospholipid-transporting ATPase IIA [Gracilaria domingensis]